MVRQPYNLLLIITALCCSGALVLPATAATVINDVSVSAQSGTDGVSSVKSTTIVDGVTVDSYEETGTGTIEHHYQTPVSITSSTTFATTAVDFVDTRATLQALVVTLRQYVSYLTSLLAASAVQHE